MFLCCNMLHFVVIKLTMAIIHASSYIALWHSLLHSTGVDLDGISSFGTNYVTLHLITVNYVMQGVDEGVGFSNN